MSGIYRCAIAVKNEDAKPLLETIKVMGDDKTQDIRIHLAEEYTMIVWLGKKAYESPSWKKIMEVVIPSMDAEDYQVCYPMYVDDGIVEGSLEVFNFYPNMCDQNYMLFIRASDALDLLESMLMSRKVVADYKLIINGMVIEEHGNEDRAEEFRDFADTFGHYDEETIGGDLFNPYKVIRCHINCRKEE